VSRFIAYPDDSIAGRRRFVMALKSCHAKTVEHYSSPAEHSLVDCEDREAFARAAGTASRPIVTEDAPRATAGGRHASRHP